MSEAEDELKHDLECLRLASDLMQLSRDMLSPELQAHCIRMANHWSEQTDSDREQRLTSADDWDEVDA